MRVLFTVQPSVGHLHPLVPVAGALSDAGHEVAVCSAASFRPEVEGFGLTHIGAGLDWLMSDQSTWEAFPPMPPPGPEFAQLGRQFATDDGRLRGAPRWRVEERDDGSAGGEPRLDNAAGAVGVAVKEAHADREDLVEAAVSQIQVLEAGDEELGLAGFHVRRIPAPRGLDHLR
jgi:hypothetical protein